MLLTRIITAAVLLPLVIGAIFFFPPVAVALLLAAFLLVGAWEWGGLLQLPAAWRGLYGLLAAAVLALLWWQMDAVPVVQAVLWAGVLWWVYAVVLVIRFPRGWDVGVGLRPVAGLVGLVILAAAFVAVLGVHGLPRGAEWLLLLFLLIWAADTGAYFAGHAYGARKLAPKVSPGKTLEGAAGGLVACVLIALVAAWWFALNPMQTVGLVLLSLFIAPVSVIGDLTESMFKRQAGIKDSGQIFPGHGGVLDRLDSLLAAAPFYLLGLEFMGVAG
ncbi:MAG: hypothetical protein CMN28_10990 [Salinisphaeraceae bacterium]|nr:hypothetical protein [Salinisphaeraceae bacterium]